MSDRVLAYNTNTAPNESKDFEHDSIIKFNTPIPKIVNSFMDVFRHITDSGMRSANESLQSINDDMEWAKIQMTDPNSTDVEKTCAADIIEKGMDGKKEIGIKSLSFASGQTKTLAITALAAGMGITVIRAVGPKLEKAVPQMLTLVKTAAKSIVKIKV